MKALLILFPLLAIVSHHLSAAEGVIKELRVSGHMANRVYHNVRVVREEPDGLRITHDSGFAKVPYEALPQEMRRQFDPSNADRFRNDQEERDRTTQTAGTVLERLRSTSRNGSLSGQESLKLITSQDVKARWLERLPATSATLRRSINTGAYDKIALLFAHDYNARALSMWGAHQESEQERQASSALRAEKDTDQLVATATSLGLMDPYATVQPPYPQVVMPAPPAAAPTPAPTVAETPQTIPSLPPALDNSYTHASEPLPQDSDAMYGYSSPYYHSRWSRLHPYPTDVARVLGASRMYYGGASSVVTSPYSTSTVRTVPVRSNYIYVCPNTTTTTINSTSTMGIGTRSGNGTTNY